MRLLIWFFSLAGLFLLLWFGMGGEDFEQIWNAGELEEKLSEAKGWAWIVGVLVLLSDVLFPVPATIVMAALGAVYGVFLGGLISSAGSVVSGLSGYGIGIFFKEAAAKRMLGEKDFRAGKDLIDRYGGWAVAISRSIPILPEVFACMAGLLRMPFRKFLVALICGSVPFGFLFAWIGATAVEEPAWGVAMCLVVPALLWGCALLMKRNS